MEFISIVNDEKLKDGKSLEEVSINTIMIAIEMK